MILNDLNKLKDELFEVEYNNYPNIWVTPVSRVPYDVHFKLNSMMNFINDATPKLELKEINELWAHLYLFGIYNEDRVKVFRDLRENESLTQVIRHLLNQYDKSIQEFHQNVKNTQIKKHMIGRVLYTDIEDILRPQLKKIQLAKNILDLLVEKVDTNDIYNSKTSFFKNTYNEILNKLKADNIFQVQDIRKPLRVKEKENIIYRVARRLEEEGDKEDLILSDKLVYYNQSVNLLKSFEFNGETSEIFETQKNISNKINIANDCTYIGINYDENLISQIRKTLENNEQKKAYKLFFTLYENSKLSKNEKLKEFTANILNCFDKPLHLNNKTIQKLERTQHFLNRIGNGPILDIISESYSDDISSNIESLLKFSDDLIESKWDLFTESLTSYNYFGFENNSNVEYIVKENNRFKEVPYITPFRKMGLTGDITKFRQFINVNPKTLIYQLALKQQPYRQYYKVKTYRNVQKIQKKEAKYYLLDMSTSMKFDNYSRAKFRDAILIAELNKHVIEAEKNGYFSPLFFQFFSDKPFKVFKVNSREDAKRFILDLMNYHRASGGTNITEAILGAFNTIKNAEKEDPDLYKATVVLVTDGDDIVDINQIESYHNNLNENLSIVMHFISLILENQDLKEFVLKQNKENTKAFYYHVTLDQIKECENEKLANQIISEFPSFYFGNGIDLFNNTIIENLKELEKLLDIEENKNDLNVESIIQNFDLLFPNIEDNEKCEDIKSKDVFFEEIGEDILQEIGFKVKTVLDIIKELRTFKFGSFKQAQENIKIFNYILEEYGLSKELYLHYLHISKDKKALKTLKKIRLYSGLF